MNLFLHRLFRGFLTKEITRAQVMFIWSSLLERSRTRQDAPLRCQFLMFFTWWRASTRVKNIRIYFQMHQQLKKNPNISLTFVKSLSYLFGFKKVLRRNNWASLLCQSAQFIRGIFCITNATIYSFQYSICLNFKGAVSPDLMVLENLVNMFL